MYVIETHGTMSGAKRRTIEDKNTFEAAYFSLLASKIEKAVGTDETATLFRIEDSKETDETRQRLFSPYPALWKPPTPEQQYGLIEQFPNKSALQRFLGLNRNTISNWQKGAQISYFVWIYLLQILGIAPSLPPEAHDLKGSLDVMHNLF